MGENVGDCDKEVVTQIEELNDDESEPVVVRDGETVAVVHGLTDVDLEPDTLAVDVAQNDPDRDGDCDSVGDNDNDAVREANTLPDTVTDGETLTVIVRDGLVLAVDVGHADTVND